MFPNCKKSLGFGVDPFLHSFNVHFEVLFHGFVLLWGFFAFGKQRFGFMIADGLGLLKVLEEVQFSGEV